METDRLVTVYISTQHRERLKALVEATSPKPKLGGMVEHLIDEALKSRGIDLETLQAVQEAPSAV